MSEIVLGFFLYYVVPGLLSFGIWLLIWWWVRRVLAYGEMDALRPSIAEVSRAEHQLGVIPS
jgi:hypothetical protein